MRPGSADIRSPEILRRFRQRYILFDEQVRSGLDLVAGDISSVFDWLQREQLPGWKRQLRRREEELKEAWRNYINARHGDRRMGKPSCVDERKAYERARRRKAEAEEKIQIVERWIVGLEQRTGKLLPPVKRLSSLLDILSPKALARLDHMMDRLEEYLRPGSSGPNSGGAVLKGGAHASDESAGDDADGGVERPGE